MAQAASGDVEAPMRGAQDVAAEAGEKLVNALLYLRRIRRQPAHIAQREAGHERA